MPFSFPNNPSVNDLSIQNGRVYVWTGTAWEIASNFSLAPSISGGNYIDVDVSNNSYVISATGVQPSGNYSVVGHNHTSANITDFNTSVSGLLPTISNSGDNRLLTSNGTSTGINAEQKLTFDSIKNSLTVASNTSTILGSGGNYWAFGAFVASELTTPKGLSTAAISWNKSFAPSSNDTSYVTAHSVFSTVVVSSGVQNGGTLWGSYILTERNSGDSNDDGSLTNLIGQEIYYGHTSIGSGVNTTTNNAYGLAIRSMDGRGTINNSYDIYLADTVSDFTSGGISPIVSGNGSITNSYGIYQQNNYDNVLSGSLTVNNGLSAPTKIFSLGTVSGNVSINYGIDKQIQTLTLNGTNTNFIEGSGWDLANKSVDVLLEITVTSTTTVTWTLVDDIYNPFPTFTAGKYIVLLRSMGSTIQGHYIGAKTN